MTLHKTLILSISLLMASCATGPIVTPQTPTQQAAVAEVTLTGLYNTLASIRPHLPAAKYKEVLGKVDDAKLGLELAKVALSSKASNSIEMLQSAQKVLDALLTELTKLQQEVKK